jgi:O-acetyl-ADP-ribose deacetylase (regulator of RNase III)
MFRYQLTENCVLVLEDGDLTKARTDAIVNAANEAMLGGGGVDGAIHRAAGPELLDACKQVEPVSPLVRCPTGEARITPGFQLPARYVIHTVGPMYRHVDNPAELLASAFRSSLRLARENGLKSIAFPAISCGAYGYPLREAADIGLKISQEEAGTLEEIRFVLFGMHPVFVWQQAIEPLGLTLLHSAT